ncbi:MAG: N-acetyltransferase [Acidobacteria bacterium]|nr:N-acetyltransferase [Acidobacteriota bacterium]
MPLLKIREEQPEDVAAIREVNNRAFGQDQEGNIVDALRSNSAALLSLVATVDGQVVGHIMYSPITVGDATNSDVAITGAALGPMSVLPEHQRHGIGTKLVETGTQKLMAAGYPFIIVLGHANFYPRFGFKPASTFGVRCEWPVPDDAFMLLVLDETKLQGVSGLAKYRHEFSTVF